MFKSVIHLFAFLLIVLLSGCALTKVITVPIKATTSVIGGAADVID